MTTKDRELEIIRTIAQNQLYHFRLSLLGMLIGFAFCIAGFAAAVMGLTGSIEWVMGGQNFSSRLSNATPGALFAICGLVVLWRYRPSMTDMAKWDNGAALLHRTYGQQLQQGHFVTLKDLEKRKKSN